MIISRREFEEMVAAKMAQERLINDVWDLQAKLKALEEEIGSLRTRIGILETTKQEFKQPWKDWITTTTPAASVDPTIVAYSHLTNQN